MRQGGSEKRTVRPEQYGRTKQKKKGEGDTDMSLMYTEEQKALIALVKEMAENEIKPYVKDADEKGECPKELYKWGFDMGLHMLEVPAEYGGSGLIY